MNRVKKNPPHLPNIFLVLLLSFILQWVGTKYLRINKIAPDFILIFIIFFSFHTGGLFALSLSFGAGLLQNILYHGLIGTNSFSFCLISYLITFLKNKLQIKEGFCPQIIFVFLGSVLYIIFSAIFYRTPWVLTLLIPKILIFSIYNSLLFALLFWGLKKTTYG